MSNLGNSTNSKQGTPLRKRADYVSRRLARILAGRVVFVLMLFIGLVIVIWMVWARVIEPLRATAGLPAGISQEIPRLNMDGVEAAEQQRLERTTRIIRNYTRFSSVFNR